MNRYPFYIHVSARLEQYESGSESGSKKKTRPELPFLTGFALSPESSTPVAAVREKRKMLLFFDVLRTFYRTHPLIIMKGG